LVEAWEASGQTIAEFCRERGVTKRRVSYWRSRLGSPDARKREAPRSRMVPVRVVDEAPMPTSASATCRIEAHLRNGRQIAITAPNEPTWIAMWIDALEGGRW